MRTITLLCLLLSLKTLALTEHIITYALSLNGLSLAEETRTLSKNDEIYTYQAQAQTSGLVKLFKDYQVNAKSSFVINDSGVKSLNYQILEKDNGTIKKDFNVNLANTRQNAVDSLSLFLALSHDLKTKPNQSKFNYLVNDGKKTKTHYYQKIGLETIQINDKPLTTIKVIRTQYVDKQLVAFFSPQYQHLPVLIKKSNKDKDYIYKLVGK